MNMPQKTVVWLLCNRESFSKVAENFRVLWPIKQNQFSNCLRNAGTFFSTYNLPKHPFTEENLRLE
jgi:hypothetical protein